MNEQAGGASIRPLPLFSFLSFACGAHPRRSTNSAEQSHRLIKIFIPFTNIHITIFNYFFYFNTIAIASDPIIRIK